MTLHNLLQHNHGRNCPPRLKLTWWWVLPLVPALVLGNTVVKIQNWLDRRSSK